MHPRRPFRSLPLLAAALLLGPGAHATTDTVTGVATSTGTSVAAPGATSAATALRVAHPTGRQDVVLQVSVGGGFTLPEVTVTTVPRYTLLGDGTVVVPADPPQTFTSWPALTPLRRFTLPESEVQRILRRASDAGLLSSRTVDYGDMSAVGIADAPTTTLTLHARGRTVTRSAYALEAVSGAGLSGAQRAARQALTDFLATLPTAPSNGTGTYETQSVALYVGPARRTPAEDATVTWPLPTPLAALAPPAGSGLVFRCTLVSGEDLATLRPSLSRATLLSPWVSSDEKDSTVYSVVARAVLPGTEGCPREP